MQKDDTYKDPRKRSSLSTNDDILSVGPSHPDMIGLLTGLGLWILVKVKKRYSRRTGSL